MNYLIQITKNTINGVEINSINARELHSSLEVKKAFTTWINTALENAGAIENEDFTKLKCSLEGSGYQYDYILTLDMAKHIAMMSKVPKSKVIRDYFIQIEKSYHQQNKILTTSEQIILLAQGHQEVEQRLTQIEHKIENDITLTSAQKYNLKQLVSKRAYELKETHKLEDSFMSKVFARFYKKLKKHFIVSSYMEIPKSKFDEAIEIVKNVSLGDLI